MIVKTVRNRKYAVTAIQPCRVSAPDGSLICEVRPGNPAMFHARSSYVVVDDDAASVTLISQPARRLFRKWERNPESVLLCKYEHCTGVDEMSAVQRDYVTDISDGVWRYSLESLENGDSAFLSVVALRDFIAELPKLKSGKNMFSGCVLSLLSVRIIAASVSCVSGATLSLGIDIRIKNKPEVAEALALLERKGWELEVQYNIPPGVPTLAELEYIESDSAANIVIPVKSLLQGARFESTTDIQIFSQQRSLLGFMGTSSLYWGATAEGYFELGAGSVATNAPYVRSIVKFGLVRDESVWLSELSGDGWSISRDSFPSALPQRWEYGLFALPQDNNYKGIVRIWSCEIICENERLLLIPVLDETGEVCMFDQLSQRYFYSNGFGTFKWALKQSPMSLRTRVTSLLLPRSPIWARLNEGVLEWCHYTGNTEGWQQFASPEEAQEILGK